MVTLVRMGKQGKIRGICPKEIGPYTSMNAIYIYYYDSHNLYVFLERSFLNEQNSGKAKMFMA